MSFHARATLALAICLWPGTGAAQVVVSFPTSDGGVVYADQYGAGPDAVILAHGGRFTSESWADQAPFFVEAGFRVLAINFRGRGGSRGGPAAHPEDEDEHLDVMAAVAFLRETGATRVSIVGASFGGGAAARAVTLLPTGEIARLVLLAHTPIENPEDLAVDKLFLVTEGDVRGGGVRRLPVIRDQYRRSPRPKRLIVLEGTAHAQQVFETDQGERALQEIFAFLSGRGRSGRAVGFRRPRNRSPAGCCMLVGPSATSTRQLRGSADAPNSPDPQPSPRQPDDALRRTRLAVSRRLLLRW